MWQKSEQEALIGVLVDLADRAEIEQWLGLCYDARGVERPDGVEYTAPGSGGFLRVRYRGDELVAAVFVEAG